MKKVIYCSVCKTPLKGRQTLFCSAKCKNHVHQSYEAQKERALERKLYFIKSKGGKCVRCGYNDNLAALSFHHRSGKEYELDSRSLSNRGLTDMEKEIAKCDLLCANCHMELHHPHLDVAKLSTEPTALTTELQARKLRGRSATHNASLIISESWQLEKKFEQNLQLCGVKTGQTVVLGVSGGVDSVVMLDLFTKSDLNLNIIVAHMNHGVREEAILDEKLVGNLAKKHGLKFILEKIERPTSGNLEEGLRNERRKFLLNNVSKNKADFLALAHNANDQAETFILNAVRGSGPAGLGAMNMLDNKIVRPLLNVSRAEIEAYAKENKLKWHEDITNKDISYNRNYVRHQILPLLERLNSEYLSAINRTTQLQRQVDGSFKEEAWHIIQKSHVIPAKAGIQKKKELDSWLATRNDDAVRISVEHLHRLDKPLLYEVFGLLFEKAKGDRQDLALVHLEALENLVSTTDGTQSIDLPGKIVARRHYSELDFYSKIGDNVPSTLSIKKLRLGIQKFGTWTVFIENAKMSPNEILKQVQDDVLFVGTEMLSNLRLRTRRPGDRISSLKNGHSKKLQDLFVDAKIDRGKRSTWPILVDSQKDQIILVPGLAKAKIDTKNKELLKIKIVEVDHETIKEK